jgi:hypothetical protein
MRAAILLCAWCLACLAQAQDGRALVEESLRRHAAPPHVYLELALVIHDAQGRYDVRTFRHYGQQDDHWLVVDTPPDLRGATIHLNPKRGSRDVLGSPILGSGFRMGDFAREALEAHDYQRRDDAMLGRQLHFVVDAVPHQIGQPGRRLYLRQDNLFVSRIDHRDVDGQLARRQSFHNPQPDESGIWRPGMILMEDLRDGRRSLLKVERRVHSPDYLPAAMMTAKP